MRQANAPLANSPAVRREAMCFPFSDDIPEPLLEIGQGRVKTDLVHVYENQSTRRMLVGIEKPLKEEIRNPYGIYVCDAKGIRHNTRPRRTSSRAYSSPRFSGGIYHLRSHYEVIGPAVALNRGNLVVDIRPGDTKLSTCTAPSFLTPSNMVSAPESSRFSR